MELMNLSDSIWKERVDAHHDQSARARQANDWNDEDAWGLVSSLFMADPLRTHDQVLNRIACGIDQDTSIIDVGGGAGRYALPLALKCRHVTVIEPSPAMCRSLQEQAEDSGIFNISVVQSSWEDASIDPADVVLCSHVISGAREVQAFLRKMEDHALCLVILVETMASPQAAFGGFWGIVYGEKRVDLPAIPELMAVLWDMGAFPSLEMLEPSPHRAVPTKQSAFALLRKSLFIRPGNANDSILEGCFDQLTERFLDGYTIKHAPLRREGLIQWRPGPEANIPD